MIAAMINPTGVISDLYGIRKTVTTAGTAERLSTTLINCVQICLQALLTNTGNIAIGGSNVIVASGSENSITLVPGQTMTINCQNPQIIWMDAEVNGEGISYLVLKG